MTSMRFCVSVLLLCALAGPAVPQAAVPGSVLAANGITRYRDGFVLVGFANGLSAAQQNAAVANVSLGTMKHLGFGVYLVNVGSGRVLGAIQSLKARGEIRFAEPDYLNELSGSPTPTDPLFGQQWGLNNTGQVLTDPNASEGAGTSGADISAKKAWGVTTGTPSVVIAVLDTGVQYTHPDLAPNIWNNPGGIMLDGQYQACPAGTHGYNAVATFPSGSVVYSDPCDPMDDDSGYKGHGTKVTGVIAATTNSGQGMAGVSWSTTILPIKWTSGDGTAWNSTLVAALNWVVQLKQAGVNIRAVNDSATWPASDADAGLFSQAVLDAINALGTNGILFVTPSGNSSADVTPGTGTQLRYPCDYHTTNMLCVAATTNTDTLWTGSNYSSTMVDLAAPGVDIVSTNRFSGYELLSGTSVSAPYVTGTAALILSTGDMTVSALKSAILNNVDVLSSLAGKTVTSGRLNACKAIPGCSTATVGALANVVLPVVTGLTSFGSVVAASTGRWTGLPDSYTYQWQRCTTACTDIPGATSAVYPVLATADVGSKLAVRITVTNTTGTVSATSAQFGPIVAAGSPFAVTSTVQDGQNVSATPSWQITSPQTLSFVQFYIDGILWQTVSNPGPYTFTPAGLSNGSHVLGVRALSNDNRQYGFYGATVTVGTVAPFNTAVPVISGTPSPAQTLTTSNGSWSNSPASFTYQWYRCSAAGSSCVPISSATSSTYVVANADIGSTIRSAVTATNGAGSTTAMSAPATVPAPPVITSVSPLVSGTNGTTYSQTLVASGTAPFTWSVTGGALPTGLSLDPATGIISGLINAVGPFTFTVQAINAAGNNSKQFSLTILPAPVALRFVPVTPCRVADTRNPAGPYGGPALNGNSRDFSITNSGCGIPANATAFSVNVTVIPVGLLGYLTLWPTGGTRPLVSTLNSDGRIKANAAIVKAGTNGSVSVFASNVTNVVIDVNGYFVDTSVSAGLAFYPMTPCRVVDTRWAAGTLGGPALAAGQTRSFPLTAGSCGIPGGAQAYSLNYTVVPRGGLSYLTTWPAGIAQPFVSTLNAPTGTVTANAAIVQAGANGSISVFVTESTDVVIDINGYFAPPAAGGLSFYAVAPCRVLDTRLPVGDFGGPILLGQRSFQLANGSCGLLGGAQAYSLNATVVPQPTVYYLTLWPSELLIPTISTLNAPDGSITSNAAIVSSFGGPISVYAAGGPTHLILDVNGFFAP